MEKNIKQEALCDLVHLSQSVLSKDEKMPMIDDEMLQRFAKALEVPLGYLKTEEEETPIVVFENNNTFTDNKGEVNFVGNTDHTNDNDNNNSYNQTTNYHPTDKISELYERIIKDREQKISSLENRIHELEQKE